MTHKISLCLLFLSVMMPAVATAQPENPGYSFDFVTLDYPGSIGTYASGINNSGTIVGAFGMPPSGGSKPFVKAGTEFTAITGPFGENFYAISDSGLIVGEAIGFGLVDLYGLFAFPNPDNPAGSYTRAYGVNAAGEIVGTYREKAYPNTTHSFLCMSGHLIDINASNDGHRNDSEILGDQMDDRYICDAYSPIEYPGAAWTIALGINNNGDIVGYYRQADPVRDRGFLYLRSQNAYFPIDYPGTGAIDNTYARGVNRAGQVVGDYYDRGAGMYRGFLKDGDTYVAFDFPNATHTQPNGINDHGVIVGSYNDGSRGHGFLATFTSSALPTITTAHMNIYNIIQGSGPVGTGEVGYGCELSMQVRGASNISIENLKLTVGEAELPLSGLRRVEYDGDVVRISAYGPWNPDPALLGKYCVAITNDGSSWSNCFEIGELEDYPKGAPEMVYPQHGQIIQAQPTFQWEEFQSIYLGDPLPRYGYELNLTVSDKSYNAWPISPEQTSLTYGDALWIPKLPAFLPGTYSLTIHSVHNVSSGISFEHHRGIQFEVVPSSIATALAVKRTEDYWGNFFDYAFSLYGETPQNFDYLILKSPSGFALADSRFHYFDGTQGSGYQLNWGGYPNVETGYYTVEKWNQGSVEVFTIPYQVKSSDIPTGTPQITYPAPGKIIGPSVTFTWNAFPIREDETVLYYVGINNQVQMAGENRETTFTLPPENYIAHVFASGVTDVLINENFVFQYIRQGIRNVQFEVVASAPEVADFIEQSSSGGSLMGTGPGVSSNWRLNAMTNMIEMANELILMGDSDSACVQLASAYAKTDNSPRPPDLVTGEAAGSLAHKISDLMDALGCSQ